MSSTLKAAKRYGTSSLVMKSLASSKERGEMPGENLCSLALIFLYNVSQYVTWRNSEIQTAVAETLLTCFFVLTLRSACPHLLLAIALLSFCPMCTGMQSTRGSQRQFPSHKAPTFSRSMFTKKMTRGKGRKEHCRKSAYARNAPE